MPMILAFKVKDKRQLEMCSFYSNYRTNEDTLLCKIAS